MRRAGRLVSFLCQRQRSFLDMCGLFFFSGCAGAAFTCSNLVLRRVGHVRFMFDRGFYLWSTRAGERAEGPRPRNAAFSNVRWQEPPSKRAIPGAAHSRDTTLRAKKFKFAGFGRRAGKFATFRSEHVAIIKSQYKNETSREILNRKPTESFGLPCSKRVDARRC